LEIEYEHCGIGQHGNRPFVGISNQWQKVVFQKVVPSRVFTLQSTVEVWFPDKTSAHYPSLFNQFWKNPNFLRPPQARCELRGHSSIDATFPKEHVAFRVAE
jgi:hypothetical protein